MSEAMKKLQEKIGVGADGHLEKTQQELLPNIMSCLMKELHI